MVSTILLKKIQHILQKYYKKIIKTEVLHIYIYFICETQIKIKTQTKLTLIKQIEINK